MAVVWQVGDRIRQRWEVHHVRPGSMGLVYVVYDHETHLPYAVKSVQEFPGASPDAVAERFIRAAQAWIGLGAHAYITQAHFVEIIDGQPLLFVEYVTGGDLRDWIGIPRLTQDLPQIVRFAIQMCDGILHAVTHGITAHRDLKPGNCLLTPDSTIKVTDMHMAAVLDGLPRAPDAAGASAVHRLQVGSGGTVAGTCTHMAPELFDAPQQADVRADIYAFGVLLFQMATGKLPFSGQTWQELAQAHRTQPPPSLSPPSAVLSPLLEACLAKEPSQRLAHFGEVRARLIALYDELTHTPLPPPLAGSALEVVQWTNAGTGLARLERYQEALACYDRALAIDAHHVPTWVYRSTVLEALGRTDDALACCDQALQLEPQSEQALVAKGMMLGALGQIEEARTYCDRALKINPRNEQAWVNIGVALDALNRPLEALSCYNNALKLNPRNEQAWFNAGVVLGDRGRHDEALGCCERALSLNPHNEQAWVNKGLTLGELQRPDEALECYERALALDPNLAPAWFNKGVTLFHAFQRYAEALACFEAAERLEYPPAADGIALCRQELGQ
ncbi:MAG TPA: serine/threonine-protein kinase [Candidatus Tectomicrobia bacterium]